MENRVVPTQAGQVCKTIVSLENERPDDVYIITGDTDISDDDAIVTAVSLKDLQRNIKDPSKALKRYIPKSNLTVVGDDLQGYIATWNS